MATQWYLAQIKREQLREEARRRDAAERRAKERRDEDVIRRHLKDLPPAEQRRIRRQIQMRKLERQLGALRLRSVVVGAGRDHAGRHKDREEAEETEEEGESSEENEGAAGEYSNEEEEEDWARFDREIRDAITDFLRPASLTASDFIMLS